MLTLAELIASVSFPIAVIIAAIILGPSALQIARIVAERKKIESEAKIESDRTISNAAIEKARIEAEAKVKAAELGLQQAAIQAAAQTAQMEREAEAAKNLEVYKTERAQIALAATQLQAETLRILGQQNVAQRQANVETRKTGVTIGGKVDAGTDAVLAGLIDVKDFFNDILGQYMKDPRASSEQIRRWMAANKEGDEQKAQAILDEPGEGPSKPTLIVPSPQGTPLSMEMRQ